jgi:hypothetical protein
MRNTSLDNVQRKDLITSLLLWGICEFVGFVLFPSLELIKVPGDTMRNWFMTSLPIGLGGVLLMVASSRFVLFTHDRQDNQFKSLSSILAGVAGWLALAGILYPMIVVCTEFFTKGVPASK